MSAQERSPSLKVEPSENGPVFPLDTYRENEEFDGVSALSASGFPSSCCRTVLAVSVKWGGCRVVKKMFE